MNLELDPHLSQLPTQPSLGVGKNVFVVPRPVEKSIPLLLLIKLTFPALDGPNTGLLV